MYQIIVKALCETYREAQQPAGNTALATTDLYKKKYYVNKFRARVVVVFPPPPPYYSSGRSRTSIKICKPNRCNILYI